MFERFGYSLAQWLWEDGSRSCTPLWIRGWEPGCPGSLRREPHVSAWTASRDLAELPAQQDSAVRVWRRHDLICLGPHR